MQYHTHCAAEIYEKERYQAGKKEGRSKGLLALCNKQDRRRDTLQRDLADNAWTGKKQKLEGKKHNR
jgi:hypothetical protein